MVLLIGGVKVDEVPENSRAVYHMAPHLKDSGIQFANTMPKMIGPVGLLYVSQREFAVCSPHDKNISIVGTDDCTTCLAIILRHPSSGATGIGHLDSACFDGISTIITRLHEVSGYFDQGPIHMHLVGSFSDRRGYSEELIKALLKYIDTHPVEIELVSCCMGELNTIVRGEIQWPIVYGVGVNLKTGDIFPATYPDKGPDIPLRSARLFTGDHCLEEIYDFVSGLLKIGPFHYEPMRCANIILQQPDEFILAHLSSSPEVEPPHVVDAIKSTLKHIKEHPFPEITIFLDNQSRYYRKEENGQWSYIRTDTYRPPVVFPPLPETKLLSQFQQLH